MSENTSKARVKPEKPRKDFPLFPHATGRWAKKVRGKLHYFGPWEDAEGALNRWLDQKDDILAGRVPRAKRAATELTLKDLCNKFLAAKKALVTTGELSVHSYSSYSLTCDELCAALGGARLPDDILPEDFAAVRAAWATRWGPVMLGNSIARVRTLFIYGFKAGLMAAPIRYGEGFNRPTRKVLRQARAAVGSRMFEADEVCRLLDSARQPLKAMILLGINCGFGNSDIGNLPISALDLAAGWVDYPRPKTGIPRRCHLWPETVQALRDWFEVRPEPKDESLAGQVFITAHGRSWALNKPGGPISNEFRKLMRKASLDGHRNFYGLRRSFETIGGESKDQVAVDAIMGHARDDMASVYREKISDDRLWAVVDTVRKWLWPKQKGRKASTRHTKE